MKLYFYILEYPYKGEPYVRIEEREVEEKKKTYRAVDNFPSGIYRRYINKTDIARIINEVYMPYIPLLQRDTAYAKNLFKNLVESNIRDEEEKLKNLKAQLQAVQKLED